MSSNVQVNLFKALPDNIDTFQTYFIDSNTKQIKNDGLFKRRILGLTSYFKSAQEQLMPKFDKDNGIDFKVIIIPMSDYQFGVYEQARIEERKIETGLETDEYIEVLSGLDEGEYFVLPE